MEPSEASSAEARDVVTNAELLMLQHARIVLMSKVVENVRQTFGFTLRQRIETWANLPLDQPHPMREKANIYLRDLHHLPHERREKEKALVEKLDDYEYNLGLHYLQYEVKAVFCTNSSSAHELLTRAFEPDLLIED